MADPRILLALASSPSGEPPTFVGLIPVVLIVGIFYFRRTERRFADIA